uniref:Uncharacterized protein n=1 Tax=Poecilia reticulata TaxID=8081 RepID=A0A3P9Q8X5_POERE
MQVLWDLRKTFRCAVLKGSTSDITNVAQEVVHLFTAGSQGQKNTVLLLISDEQMLDKLKKCIMSTIAKNKIVTNKPVAILLSCVRKDVLLESDNVVLQRQLSDKEKQKFREKREELKAKYGDITQLHGFNIMQTNFSERYIQKSCEVFRSSRKARRPLKAQLAAFLALLNAYAPGSYLLESECLNFLRYKNSMDNDGAVEELMQPFSHLIVTFQQNDETKRRVRMAHPLIAKCCTEMLAHTGVPRSDTTRNFLNNFCRDEETEEFPQCLLGFVKDILTKREAKTQDKTGSDAKEDQERFSKLILDIQKMEGGVQCVSVLKVASKKFNQNPFFPQALSRFYYIEMKNYYQAEMWAKAANLRDPKNSFIADTLGQVYKNHLKAKEATAKSREILKLAKDAIEAFKHEEQLAEDEQETDMKEDGMITISNVFNSRGQFGFLQVCKILYDLLVSKNKTWREVLTKNVPLCSVLHMLGDSKLYRFNDLINILKDEVERKSEFFDKYLTYSKYSTDKEDPEYIFKDITDCYRKYIGNSPLKKTTQKIAQALQMLKKNRAATSAGVLACLDRAHTEKDLKEIATWWKEIWSSHYPGTAEVNYILAVIMLVNTGETLPAYSKPFKMFGKKIPMSEKDPPEQHMLALLLFWPANSEDECEFDLSQLIQQMRLSYEHTYQKHFQSRYLPPLFFIGKGQSLERLVHRKVVEQLSHKSNETKLDRSNNWRNESIFQNDEVRERLLRVEGRVRNYRVFATVGGTQIEIEANSQRNLWRQRRVSFYIGFTIRGPVAFSIQTENHHSGKRIYLSYMHVHNDTLLVMG